jgi:tetrahydromethanopterin S-methyltransferase subunit B
VSERDVDRIYTLLEKLDGRVDSIDVTLARNTTTLEEHIKRTALLEADMKPIKAHVHLMNTLAKVGSALLALILAAEKLGLLNTLR